MFDFCSTVGGKYPSAVVWSTYWFKIGEVQLFYSLFVSFPFFRLYFFSFFLKFFHILSFCFLLLSFLFCPFLLHSFLYILLFPSLFLPLPASFLSSKQSENFTSPVYQIEYEGLAMKQKTLLLQKLEIIMKPVIF